MHRSNTEAADDWGRTPLHWASDNNHSALAAYLIADSGAIVDSTTPKGITPMHLACRAGNLEVVRILIEAGANVNLNSSTNQPNTSPLGVAQSQAGSCRYNAGVVKLLLACGAVNNGKKGPRKMSKEKESSLGGQGKTTGMGGGASALTVTDASATVSATAA